jgi:hypothetical protein
VTTLAVDTVAGVANSSASKMTPRVPAMVVLP